MKLRFLVPINALIVAYLSIFGTAAFADAFKNYAPSNWKKVSQKGDNSIYKNLQSGDNETIVLQAFAAQSKDTQLLSRLNLRILTQSREKFLNTFGIGNYTALAAEMGRAKDSRFKNYVEIDSLFRDLQNHDVQMIERQYVANGKMFVVSYLIDAPAINDRKRAARALDAFQPIWNAKQAEQEIQFPPTVVPNDACKGLIAFGIRYFSTDAYADEVVQSSGSSTVTSPGSASTATPASSYNEQKMSDSEIAQQCKDVPAEKRRTAADNSFMGQVKTTLSTPGSCLMGVASNAWDIVKGAYDILAGGVKMLFSSEYRSEVTSTVGVVAAEIYKSPTEFALRVASEMGNAIKKYAGETFPCLKPSEQIKSVCKLASNLIPAGMLAKVLTKAPLLATESARLAKLARDAIDIQGSASKADQAIAASAEKATATKASDLASTTAKDATTDASSSTAKIDADSSALQDVYKKAPAAKQEIDNLADQIAADNGGTAAKVPLKGQDRAIQKVNDKYAGDVSRLNDIARNTIVVPQGSVQTAIDTIKAAYPDAVVDVTTADSNARGWSMVQASIATKAGLRAEIQINSPEMIYAGFKESQAREILGNAAYNAIQGKAGIQGGLSHILYEQVRTLDKTNPRKAVVEDLCRRYHDIIRQGAAGKTKSQLDSLIKDFDNRLDSYVQRYDPGDRQLMNMAMPVPAY
jgi:hypothetical protein